MWYTQYKNKWFRKKNSCCEYFNSLKPIQQRQIKFREKTKDINKK